MFAIDTILMLIVMTCLLFCVIALFFSINFLQDIIVLSSFSFFSAIFYILADGVDVALTEVSVSVGVSTIVFLLTSLLIKPEYNLTGNDKIFNIISLFVIALCLAVFLSIVPFMPLYGDSMSPGSTYISPVYVAQSYSLYHIPNVVTMILGSFRGYDTVGETAVIVTAATSVIVILKGIREK